MPIPMTFTQIADDVEERIRAGEYRLGAQFLTYRELGELYSVGYTTAAKVISLLKDRGILIGVPGRGVYVPEQLP